MSCYYIKGDEKIKATDILKNFYKDTLILKNAEIYSSEELEKNTADRILQFDNSNNYSSSEYPSVIDFITKPNDAFTQIPGLSNQNRLAPEYIREQRAIVYINEHITDEGLLNNITSSAEVDDLYIKVYDQLNDTAKNNTGKVKYLLSMLIDDFNLEELNKDFGIELHALISDRLRGRDQAYSTKLTNLINNEKFTPILGISSKDDWKAKLNIIIDNIQKQIMNIGVPISEISFVYDDSPKGLFAVKGKIDLIAVDSKGTAHIFEIKVSSHSYARKHWDSAKLLTLDWQLAIYKQLLSQAVDVQNTQLYVLPIVLNNIGDPNAIKYEGIFNRNTESSNGLLNGRIETISNRLIPRGIHAEYDETKIEKFREKLTVLFGEDYEIRLRSKDKTVEAVLNSAKKRHAEGKSIEFEFFNEYSEIPNLSKGYVKAATLEELAPLAEQYVIYDNSLKHKKVTDLKLALTDAIRNHSKISTSNSEHDLAVNRLLLEYTSENWEVLNEFPESEALGIILLRDRNTGQINVISLSANQFLAESSIQGFNEGDIEYAKALLFLNEYKKELLPYSTNKIGEIIVFNPENKKHYYRTTHTQFKHFQNLMLSSGFKESDINLSVENNFLGIVNIALQNLDNFYKSFISDADKIKIEEIIKPLLSDDNLVLTKLIEAQRELYITYPEYKKKSFSAELNFEDKIEVLVALLNSAIVSFYKDDLSLDFKHISTYSMNFSDYKSLFSALYSDANPAYDKEGRKITGIFQGLIWTTPDWVPSKELRSINKLMSGANSKIGEIMLSVSEDLTKNTFEYYDAINFTESERFLIGETQSKYKNLWKQNNGEVSAEFILKNPYKDDVENALTDAERKYLKKQLLIINAYRLEIPQNEIANINSDELVSILRHPELAKAIENGTYFDMPLVRREENSKYKGAFKTAGETWKEKLAPYTDEFMDFLDARGLTKTDIDEVEKTQMGFYEMYDTYAAHTQSFKAKIMEQYRINYFEFNLDTIAHRLIFNKVRKNVYDKIFPVVNAYVWWMKVMAGKSDDKISDQLKYVSDQIKLSAFGQHIIDPEFKDLSIGQAMFKRVTTAMMLAFRPILMVKELTIGTFKGISLAATKIYGKDQFSIKDLTAAYTKLMTVDKKFAHEFNLIDKLNAYYRFANMDANTLALKLQADRHGFLMRGMSRYMYASNTIPDYYNRLSLFLAKMIHDGSYEAHSNDNGKFLYDPRKDKRFSYYLEHRDKYKKFNGEFDVAKADEKYNTQRRHYLLLISQLNKEYAALGESFTEQDLIPKAYSEEERASFKTFTDMAYGYYDKDAQQQATNTWWGLTWMQFMQFWPGKMKMWFAKPIDEENKEDSAIGSAKQKTTIENGQEVKWWRKTVQKEDGSFDIVETTENTGDPVIEWQGTPFEGLAYSVLSTVKDLAKLDFKAVSSDKARLGKVAFAIHDAIFMYLIMLFFASIFKALKEEYGDSIFTKETLEFGEKVTSKIANEHNLYQSTFGALRAEPAWISWAQRFGQNIGDVINNDKTILQAASRVAGALEPFKEEE